MTQQDVTVRCLILNCSWEGEASLAAAHGRTMHPNLVQFEKRTEKPPAPDVKLIRAWRTDCAGTCAGNLGFHVVLEEPSAGMLVCDCPGFAHQKTCRHRTAVLEWIRRQPHTVITAQGSGGWKPKLTPDEAGDWT